MDSFNSIIATKRKPLSTQVSIRKRFSQPDSFDSQMAVSMISLLQILKVVSARSRWTTELQKSRNCALYKTASLKRRRYKIKTNLDYRIRKKQKAQRGRVRRFGTGNEDVRRTGAHLSLRQRKCSRNEERALTKAEGVAAAPLSGARLESLLKKTLQLIINKPTSSWIINWVFSFNALHFVNKWYPVVIENHKVSQVPHIIKLPIRHVSVTSDPLFGRRRAKVSRFSNMTTKMTSERKHGDVCCEMHAVDIKQLIKFVHIPRDGRRRMFHLFVGLQ